jgi:hypothetical protein
LVADRLWELLEPRIDDRAALEGILFVLHTGCRWRDPPPQLGCGSGHTTWQRLRAWPPPATGTPRTNWLSCSPSEATQTSCDGRYSAVTGLRQKDSAACLPAAVMARLIVSAVGGLNADGTFISWRLGFRQSSFRHITRVPQRAVRDISTAQ